MNLGDITLHVHTNGLVLHIFVNGKHIGNLSTFTFY